MTHVQLLHGDSDKASSFNPVTAFYDNVFVAGQAGIDRYENNGVDIPKHKFTIVGRPQVESVEQQGRSESTRLNSRHVAHSYAVLCLKKKKKIDQFSKTYTSA